MIDRGPATEDEMISAFLRAEIYATRYPQLHNFLRQLGINRSVVDKPNPADPAENTARRTLLQYRGYCSREFLFARFPFDVEWRRVLLEPRDFETMRYAKHPTWTILSGGTRLVIDGARNFSQRPVTPDTDHIIPIAEAIRSGEHFPELIAVTATDGSLILVEGHSRGTAYVLEQYRGTVEALVGSSESMPSWAFY